MRTLIILTVIFGIAGFILLEPYIADPYYRLPTAIIGALIVAYATALMIGKFFATWSEEKKDYVIDSFDLYGNKYGAIEVTYVERRALADDAATSFWKSEIKTENTPHSFVRVIRNVPSKSPWYCTWDSPPTCVLVLSLNDYQCYHEMLQKEQEFFAQDDL